MANDERATPELRDLARREDAGLSAEARARVLANLQMQGPKLVRRARIQRQVTRVGGTIAGLLFAVGGAWLLARSPGSSSDGGHAALARACETRPVQTHAFTAAEDGGMVLDLGARAFVRAEPGSRVSIVHNESCRLVLSLEEGRVDVHARDLGAGALEVLTTEGTVHVKGTIFSVARMEGELTVDVAEGVVEVTTPDEPKASVPRGQRLKRHKRRAERSGLEEEQEVRLLLAVGAIEAEDTVEIEEPVAVLEEPTSGALVDEPPSPEPRKSLRKKRRFKRRRSIDREPRVIETPAPQVTETPPIPPMPAVVPEAPEPPAVTLRDLLSEAERLKRAGDLRGARQALRRAGAMAGPDARAAWIALARLELQAGNTREVRRAVSEYHELGGGPLEPEGAWLLVRAEERAGRLDEARAEAESLIKRWPRTPQAEEARRWLQRADAGAVP